MKVSVLGAAGGIGQSLSLLLKTQMPAKSQLALYDISDMVHGVAVDLSHISTPVQVSSYVGDQLSDALSGSDLVIILAGIPRKPGMTRADLLGINAGIVKGLVEEIGRSCPKACIGIVTNPVNAIIPVAAKTLQAMGVYDPNRLFGISLLDQVRTQTFVAQALGLDPEEVRIPVVGGHSAATILPLLSQLPQTLTEDDRLALVEAIKTAGDQVVEAKAGNGSATLSMAYAAARFAHVMIEAFLEGTGEICAYVASDDLGIDFFARPVRLGKEGIAERLGLGSLSAWEEEQLALVKAQVRADISQGYDAIAHKA